MKKRIFSVGLVAGLCLLSLFVMTACGNKEPYSDYDLNEYVKVGEYKGLEYDKIVVSVSEEDIQQEIQSRCEAKATITEEKSGTVAKDDNIVIAYEGKIDGKTFEGGSSEQTDITVGQAGFIPGFEDGLIGKKVGETVKLDLKFPDSYYQKDLAGKDVTFEVNIKAKKIETVPKYDLDFVKENSEYDNLKDYEASVKKDLEASKKADAENEMKTQLWQKIVQASEVKKYPKEKDEYIKQEKESLEQDAKNNNLSYEEYLETNGYTVEQMDETLKSYCENKVLEEMVLYSIAKKEDLQVTDKEYEKQVDDILKSSGMDEKTFKESFKMSIEEWCESRSVRYSMLLEKVINKVISYGTEKK